MIITNKDFLRNKSQECTSLDEVADIDLKLRTWFRGRNALGLSAPQLGILKRIFIMDIDGELTTLVHPKIISTVEGVTETHRERCLSFPDMVVEVTRPSEITVTDATEKIVTLTGMPAIVFQHELDHLDGILFFDRGKILFERRISEKIDRNGSCPCGSGKKYKKCHGLL